MKDKFSKFESGMASLSSQADWNDVDIVCGALSAKLQTKNLSSGSSRCISFGGQTFTPCEFERHAGKSSSRNWKSSIRCCGKPLSSFIEMYETLDGKRRCRFVTSGLGPLDTTVNSSESSNSSSVSVSAGQGSPTLPDFPSALEAQFTWGSMDSQSFCHALEATYQEVVHWRSNCFKIPQGNVTKKFVVELARLFRAAGEGSTLECIALKAAFTLCSLVLQKPSRSSKSKDHVSCIERRLNLWKDGNLNELVLEGRAIQQRLSDKYHHADGSDPNGRLAYSFAKFMFDGKTKRALDILSGQGKGRLLHLSEIVNAEKNTTVRDALESKHPSAAPLYPDCLDTTSDSSLAYHPTIFDALDGSVIRAAALHTSGSAGPSGVDAYGWRRLCTAFKSASAKLCCSVAILARRLCTSFVDPEIVLPLVSV